MAKGSCLCGEVAYEADLISSQVTKCHCRICQKTSGSAYGDFVVAHLDTFRWIRGEKLLKHYQSSADSVRLFCTACGTHMPTPHAPLNLVFVQPGTLDTDEALEESAHMFVRSKAKWHRLDPDLQQFNEYPILP